MSISRALFKEFRPFFKLMEDPFSVNPSFPAQGQFHEPFGGFSWQNRLALNLTEGEDGSYLVEAEVPGVKKENLDIKVGDGGRSLTIEGRVVRGVLASSPAPAPAAEGTSKAMTTTEGMSNLPCDNESMANSTSVGTDKEVATTDQNGWNSARTFTRTIWLPHPINAEEVKAKLEDGILTIRAERANQKTVNVSVE
jgi:HSP20 family molecular chaperone IbpA